MTASAESPKARVLVIHEPPTLGAIAQTLVGAGYEVATQTRSAEALAVIDQRRVQVVVCAFAGVEINGMELLSLLRRRRPDIPTVMLAADQAVDAAVAAMRAGAFDFVPASLTADGLAAVVARAVEVGHLRHENWRLRQQLSLASSAAGFIADSPQSKQLVTILRRAAATRSTVLIEGESGTGKEIAARLLHYWSNRADGPFVAVNCKAFADGVVESELFGHEKGSFTGAVAARAGCFERASSGTLFLDEVAEAGRDFQAKLLRVLEDGEVLRVGGSKPRRVDVRIVAATNRKLKQEVAAGHFRTDLYYRLNVIPVRIAPLRERREDILPLARHFLAFHGAATQRPLNLSPEAEHALLGYQWPGNVRELENIIERAVVLSGAEMLSPEAFALDPVEPEPTADLMLAAAHETLQEYLDRAAAEKIQTALHAAHGSRGEAAAALGIDRTTLYRLMKRLLHQ